ncbi:phosphatase PAP2 family protein [Corynebacterium poyangense]|uniref:Phosphatase PAP2 family protein n=1 Tax=Corynebacterium poyangense TaxID=2684405 RepID=A0A7H0SMN6_9CORY|nr:phosphatase PAP2 family protein [Corynebacterium poyangense]MBZ8176919.1 phosphatase PAP2 family protein [Corynebacterium poyangense]QNQ89811.1 phosphatase PAP2 family protein [Corynebacterium poyangense]
MSNISLTRKSKSQRSAVPIKQASPQVSHSQLNRGYVVVLIAILVLMAAFTWTEQGFSARFANQNSVFGTFFQTFGEFPPVIISAIALNILIHYLFRKSSLSPRGITQFFSWLACLLLTWGAFLILLDWSEQMMNYLRSWRKNAAEGVAIGVANNDSGSQQTWEQILPAVMVALVLTAVVCCLTHLLLTKMSDATLKAFTIAAICTLIVIWLGHEINTGMKDLWGRFRPYEVAAGKGEFTLWWDINLPNGHRSFPSGHTEEGTILAALGILLRPLGQKIAYSFLWIGAAYGVIMGISRVAVAAHYPTDTIASFGLTFAIIAIGLFIYESLVGSEEEHRVLEQQ